MSTPVSPELFRKSFPIFESKVFLNSCSKGALARSVEAAYQDYLSSWASEGSPWDDWVALLETVRSRFASFINASPDEIAVSFCASTAVGSLASALSIPKERNRLLLGDFEFPTLAHNWLALQRRGVEIVRVRAEGERLPVRSYEEVLDGHTLLVPVSHVCFRNGYRQDVSSLVSMARAAGAYSLIDDYQSTGTRPLDVSELGCDFLVTGCLKYLLGSSGLAFLYVRRELIEALEPVLTGWFAQARPFDFDIERLVHHESARRFETGTPAVPSLYAGLAGLDLIAEVGTEVIAAHVESLASELIRAARERGIGVLTPEEPGRRGPLVVLACRDSVNLVKALAGEGIVVSARGRGLRVSFHYYNIHEDVSVLMKALDRHSEFLGR